MHQVSFSYNTFGNKHMSSSTSGCCVNIMNFYSVHVENCQREVEKCEKAQNLKKGGKGEKC